MSAPAVRLSDALRGGGAVAEVEGLAADFLRQACDEPGDVEATWHPLGFLHFKAWSSGKQTLRFHIWPADRVAQSREPAISRIHDHVWDLLSQVLCGSLENQTIRIEEAAQAASNAQLAHVEYAGSTNVVRPLGKLVHYSVADSQIRNAGDRYVVPPGEFHRTQPGEERPLATVVSAVVVRDAAPRTLVPCDQRESVQMTREPCMAEDLRRALSPVVDQLSTGA